MAPKSVILALPRCLDVIGFASLVLLVAVPVAQARADHECTQESLNGAYGYAFSGPFVGVGPVGAVGLMIFDGAGGLTAQDTTSINGEIGHRTGAGSYAVNHTCTGSATLGDDFAGFAFDLMIVPGTGGSEFSFLVTNRGAVQSGVASKTEDKGCSDASLIGTYRVVSSGSSLDLGQFAAVGFRVLDGGGNLTRGDTTLSRNGEISRSMGLTATYSVNSDCTVSVQFATGQQYEGVVVGEGREAYFLQTAPRNTIVTVVLYKKQSRHHRDD
jgi:hypothetical protein